MRTYPQVNWRYLIQEKNKLSGFDELIFNNETIWAAQINGREQAKEALLFGPGYGFRNVSMQQNHFEEVPSLTTMINNLFI